MLTTKASQYFVIFFRFCIATIILVVNAKLFGLGLNPVYYLICSVYVLTIIYLLLILAKISHARLFYAQIIADLIIETMLVHYTGGIDSVLSLMYPLSTIAASIMISPRAAIVIAFLGSTLYSVNVTLETLNILPMYVMGMNVLLRENSYIFTLLYFRVTVFCIIGFLSAYIAQQVNKKDKIVNLLQKKLQREDKLLAIGKLAANTAHEIRNPLASISGCVEALKENLDLSGNNKKLFELIIKETNRLNDIINGLLEYVKPRQLQIARVSLSELIEEVIFLVKNNKFFNANIILKNESNDQNLKINCDPQQIKQVLFNLLINAVEAIEKSGKIIIKHKYLEAIDQVQIEISDNGQGIGPQQLENLFEPFSSGRDKGVGLGLAIVLSIVKEHGGDIKVSSKLGRGTIFHVFLPVRKESNL
ncbi:MAG: ATP-binding protein [Candidatus Omnitrophota bacterium]